MRVHHPRPYHRPPTALSDQQLAHVMDAARALPVVKRDLYLQRISALLTFRNVTDSDVEDVIRLALVGLVQQQHTDGVM